MLKAKIASDIDTTTELFQQLSISLDSNKFLRHKHITAKPKLKRLVKFKSSCSTSIPINITENSFCSRCKKETLLGDHVGDLQSIPEKEVEEVKKEFIVKSLWEKKVNFLVDGFGTLFAGEKEEKADEKKAEPLTENHKDSEGKDSRVDESDNNGPIVSASLPEQECTSLHFQSVFFARRPSIIGNNEFWLPQYSSPDANATKEESVIVTKPSTVAASHEIISQEPEEDEEEGTSGTVEKVARCIEATEDGDQFDLTNTSLLSELSVFLNGIFKQTFKRQVNILQVTTLLNDTLLALTEEYMFHCQRAGNGYEFIDVVCLKDVEKIMVNDSCVVLVLEVCHASSLTEFKEFVPGYSEKTESLISLMVFALSRIKKFLPDVTRLPLLSLPTCEVMQSWLFMQNEEIMYTGIVKAENISEPDYEVLREDNFMMNIGIGNKNQFHPVTLLVRSGYLTSKCNGGCASGGCKYSMTLGLEKEKVSVMRREDKPWPNCVRLVTECIDITFAGISKASADDLMEKLYTSSIQPIEKNSMKFYVCVLITENYLQLFKMTLDKIPLFGSPLLNLEVFDEVADGTTCIIDAQGVEVDDDENLQIQNRWHLTFLDKPEKIRFLNATTVSVE